MTIALDVAAVNFLVATVCGAVIGSERQVRQRMAGLRTNALVALGPVPLWCSASWSNMMPALRA